MMRSLPPLANGVVRVREVCAVSAPLMSNSSVRMVAAVAPARDESGVTLISTPTLLQPARASAAVTNTTPRIRSAPSGRNG